ncbi:hypothetical protein HZ326_25976 [Fusarium oxysporum f. sp. albedinis]|nr:hypothetical protein HZ326_25976 [Fusarium oxysporum f. sp. albedinis]
MKSKNETLDNWFEKAYYVDYQVTPGDPFSETLTTSSTPNSTGDSSNYHVDDNSHGNGLSAGAVAGLAIGGTVVLLFAIGAIYFCSRRGGFDKASHKRFSSTVPTYPDGKPPVLELQSERNVSRATDVETNTIPGNSRMDEEDLQTTNESARPLYQESKRHAPCSKTAPTNFLRSLLPKTSFRLFFRRLGHKLNPYQRFKDINNDEPLKEVYSNSRSSALWHFILFHLPAVLVTIALLVLHIKKVRWAQTRPTADELAALQFAAKVQESLILISLMDILLHRIRYGLLGRNGIPLGFLSSPFNLGFSLRYLVSWEFWSAMLNPTINRHFHGATAAMVLFFSLLGLTAGPSSAIAMIPRYDWWQLSNSASLPLFWRSSFSEKWALVVERDPYPLKFESKHIPDPNACFISEVPDNNQTCVNRDLTPMLQELRRVLDHAREPSLLTNISVSGAFPGGLDRPITLSVDSIPVSEEPGPLIELAYAVTPMDFVAHSLGEDVIGEDTTVQEPRLLLKSEALTVSGKERWKQPLVAAHCAQFDWLRGLNETSATFDFDDFYDNITVSLNLSSMIELPKTIINDDNGASRLVASNFLNIQHLLPRPITASILFAYPDRNRNPPDLNKGLIHMHLCLVQARWVEAEVWVHPKESLELQSHLGFPSSNAMDYIRQKSNPQDIINISFEWLRNIGVPPISDSSTLGGPFNPLPESVITLRENPAFRQGINMCSAGVRPTCIPAFLAIYLANAMSRLNQIPGSGSRSPKPNSTVIFNTWFDHVYAYEIEDSITVPLAFTALLLQVLFALIHLILTVFARHPWHCSAWGDFGQLLTLALRSKLSNELSNVGAGVQSSGTWRLVTIVREVGKERQLEMVVDVPMAMLSGDQISPDEEEQGTTQMRIPPAGVEYG